VKLLSLVEDRDTASCSPYCHPRREWVIYLTAGPDPPSLAALELTAFSA
jgi:hypothetical protein